VEFLVVQWFFSVMGFAFGGQQVCDILPGARKDECAPATKNLTTVLCKDSALVVGRRNFRCMTNVALQM